MGTLVRFQEIGSNVAPEQSDGEKIARIQVLATAFMSGRVSIFSISVHAASAHTVCGL